jgi:bacillaene synthase trans-acting acyltransferase
MRKLIFMCAGQGCQYYQMARHFYESDMDFRHNMDTLDREHVRLAGFSVVRRVYDDAKWKSDPLETLPVTHPAIFMVQYALGRALMNAGFAPDQILGSSLGEYVSLALAGVVRADELLSVLIRQANSIVRHCCEARMIAVLAGTGRLAGLETVNHHIRIALVNGPSHTVVVTDVGSTELVQRQLRDQGIPSQILPIQYGFHTAMIDAARPECEAAASELTRQVGSHHVESSVDSNPAALMSPAHLWRVVREPVRFDLAVERLEHTGPNLYIDLSPTGTLSGFVKSRIGGSASEVLCAVNPFAGRDGISLQQLRGKIHERRPLQQLPSASAMGAVEPIPI